jgi:hypothetical protein
VILEEKPELECRSGNYKNACYGPEGGKANSGWDLPGVMPNKSPPNSMAPRSNKARAAERDGGGHSKSTRSITSPSRRSSKS